MNKKLITIKETAKKLDVSLDTLRRWDKSGKLKSVRFMPSGHRHYYLEDIELLLEDIFSLAKKWILNENPYEIKKEFYCQDSLAFQYRLVNLENNLKSLPELKENFSLISAIVGEIGNNSFDHNIGSWRDIRGIFFATDMNKRQIVLADRGQGILKTLQRIKPKLSNDEDALYTAFTEKISGRAPENRGNGLKFVRKIITQENRSLNMKLYFQSGEAVLILQKGDLNLKISKSEISLKGCLAFINF